MSEPPDFTDRSAEELEKLLWERIDGTISAADAARLSKWTIKEPEAAGLEAEIGRLAAQLDDVEEEPLPDGLADEIRQGLGRVRPAAAATGARADAATGARADVATGARADVATGARADAWHAALLGPRPARRLVYLAATLALAVVGYQLITGDSARDAGTLSGSAGMTEAPAQMPAERLELPRSLGALTLSRGVGVASVELETSPSLRDARLVVTGTDLSVERTGREGEATFDLQVDEGAIHVEVTGTGKVTLAVTATGRLTVTVEDAGGTLVSHSF